MSNKGISTYVLLFKSNVILFFMLLTYDIVSDRKARLKPEIIFNNLFIYFWSLHTTIALVGKYKFSGLKQFYLTWVKFTQSF